MPKVEVNVLRGGLAIPARYEMWNVMGMLSIEHDGFRGKTRDEVETIVEGYFVKNGVKNVYTELLIRKEDSPGNYAVLEDERGIILRWYAESMSPFDVVLTAAEDGRRIMDDAD